MNAIEIKKLTKKYKDVTAVDGLELSVRQGELFALLGVNGAGKTTTIKMLSCLTAPTSGEAYLGGKSIVSQPNEVKRIIGVSPQETAVAPNLTVMENILLPLSLGKNRKPDKERITYLTELLGIQNMLSEYPTNLSGGEQRRVSIARTFAQNPKLVVADEPTSSLDMENSEIIMKYFQKMAKEGTTILVSTHDREFANYADRCLWMKKGKLEKRELE